MMIIAFFTESGEPKSGLSPTIDIARIDTDALIVNGAAMTALSVMTHAYKYDFTDYDDSLNYAITVDGGAALNNIDRYKYSGNENQGLEFIKDIEGGGWHVDDVNNQMIFYKSDNITEVARFNLFRDGSSTVIFPDKRERV